LNPRRPAPEDFSASTPLSPPPSPRGIHSPLLRPVELKDLGPSKQQKDTPKISTFNSNLKRMQQELFQVAPFV